LNKPQDKSCLNRVDKTGNTALGMAASRGYIELARILVEAEANVNSGMLCLLNLSLSFLQQCNEWLQKGDGGEPQREQILASRNRIRGEATVEFLMAHGMRIKSDLEIIRDMNNGTFEFQLTEVIYGRREDYW
jgi:hypothetical protein